MLITGNIMFITEAPFNNVNNFSFIVTKYRIRLITLLCFFAVISAFFLVINLLTPLILLLIFN
jgi:hypothetical protein